MTNKQTIQNKADSCVMCGMCSSSCPTYQINGIEHQSPRGRISLINAWAQDKLPLNSSMAEHIGQCLQCGQCEKVCPSGVKYNEILTEFKQVSGWSKMQGRRSRRLISILRSPRLARRLFESAYLAQRSGLAWLGEKSGLLAATGLQHLNTLSGGRVRPSSRKTHYKADGPELALFTGCVGRHIEQDSIDSTLELLAHLGYAVHLPQDQACCGALAGNNGDLEAFERDIEDNLRTLSASSARMLVYFASGCASSLKNLNSRGFDGPIIDIIELLEQAQGDRTLRFKPLEKSILVHIPCSMRNGLKNAGNPMNILRQIPQANVCELKARSVCCGAGGSHLLNPQTTNTELQRQVIEDIARLKPDILVTSNTGCRLQLEQGLKQAGLDIPVRHPVVLIHQQLATE